MARAREGKRVLLLVDEVQNLSPSALEELRMLSNFQVGEKSAVTEFSAGAGRVPTDSAICREWNSFVRESLLHSILTR